ncbi:MAG: nuclear transport factor 2 family protein [Parvibaculum sp.]|nr:nuclear transport factor 2 family protein [Parvibaculum sp.]
MPDVNSVHTASSNTDMQTIATALAVAKSRQDIDEAMRIYHPDIVLETPPFGTVGRGADEVRAQLGIFFQIFPDYEVALENSAFAGEDMIGWGRIRVTLTGEFANRRGNGTRAEVPVFIVFRFRDGRCIYESFNFDLASLCRQSGLPAEALVA